MKKILTLLVMLLPVLAFSETKTEPISNSFESKVISRLSEAKSDTERFEIINESLGDKRAGAALFFNAANLFAQKPDFEQARGLYVRALELMPNFYMAHRNLGYLYYTNGMHSDAITSFAAALALSGVDAGKIYGAYSFSLMSLGRYDEALTAVENALMLSPDDGNLLHAKAKCLYESGQLERLKKFCGPMLGKYPTDAVYWRMSARLDIQSGDLPGAAANLQALVNLGLAENADHILLGGVYANMRLFEKAAEAYGDRLGESEKAYEISRFFALSGAFDESLKIAKNLKADSPEFLEVDAIVKGTKDAFEKAYAANPANSYVALRMADFLMSDKRFESARVFYMQAQKEFPLRAEWGMASSYVAEGEYAKASKLLKKLAAESGRGDLNEFIMKLDTIGNER